jgi:hypothetical protein
MQQHEIHDYLTRFFEANHCEIFGRNPYCIDVQLTVEMDKILMNRPFYWHYLEKTGGEPNPMRLTFITDQNKAPENLKGEVIHYGSPRLHQVFAAVRDLGSYIRLYEDVRPNGMHNIPLHPWLGVNMRVSYQCDRKKDMLYSYGLHLISGTIVDHFHETIRTLPLTPKIPDFCFTLTPMIKPQSGLSRIEQAVKSVIEQDDHSWADAARERWNHDLNLLKQFYEDADKLPESYETEKKALQEQYEPKIKITFVNGGLFYLTPDRI